MRFVLRAVVAVASWWLAMLATRSWIERQVADRPVGASASKSKIPAALVVNERLWRGPAPGVSAYAQLADAGVSLIVDLRAEADPDRVRELVDPLGVELLWLPTVNTRVPHRSHLSLFDAAMVRTDGITYVHCEAGEGRTGAIVGAWRVAEGAQISRVLADNLAVGSLTFAQLAFVGTRSRFPAVAHILEWGVDRPTEALLRFGHRFLGS